MNPNTHRTMNQPTINTTRADADAVRRMSEQFEKRALIATFSGRKYTNMRRRERAAREVESNHDAESGTVRNSVYLFDTCAQYKRLVSIVNRARNAVHYTLTIPWSKGEQLLPSRNHDRWLTELRELQRALEHEAKPAFRDVFDAAVERDRQRLGKLFNPNDYTDAAAVVDRFEITFRARTFRAVRAPQVQIAAKALQELAAAEVADMKAKTGAAVESVYRRVVDTLTHYANAMENYDPKARKGTAFRDSTVDAVRELVDLLPALNLHDDPALYTLADDLHRRLRADAETLRTDSILRREHADAAKSLVADAESALASCGII